MAGRISTDLTRALVFAGTFVAALSLACLPAAAKECQQDAGGGCQREGMTCSPSDAPPANGNCYTVKQERVLKCLCLVKKPTASTRPAAGGGHVAISGECYERCQRKLINCAADAKTLEERNKCFRQHQECLEDCGVDSRSTKSKAILNAEDEAACKKAGGAAVVDNSRKKICILP